MDYRLKQIYAKMLSNPGEVQKTTTPSLYSIIEAMNKSSSKSEEMEIEFEPENPEEFNTPAPTPTEASGYDQIISKRLGGNIQPRGIYLMGKSVKITDSQDLKHFQALFDLSPPTKSDPTGTSKGSGKGEIAIYWLLKKKYPSIRDNRSIDLPDLEADGVGLEIKSYPEGKGFKLGKFKSQKENRNILSIVLGIKALSEIKGQAKRVAAVDVFNGKEITSAFNETIKLAQAFSKLDPNIVSVLKELPLIAQLQNQFDDVSSFLGGPLSKLLPTEAAGIMLKRLLIDKCKVKPGFGGYIANISSNGTIHYYQADEEKINSAKDEEIVNFVSATSGELEISKPEHFFIKS